MKGISTLIAAAGLAAPLLSQTAPASPESCLHIGTSFSVLVQAPLAVTAPLFGPLGERPWVGKHWDPTFIYPQPARDQEGAVFTVYRENTEVWVNTLFDMDQRHFQYVYFLPELAVTIVDVRFEPVTADSTRVDVVFTRTAISPQGNERVKAMSEIDKNAAPIWKQKIDNYLASQKTASPQ